MQLGNRKALDAAREALRDQFDAIWMASPVKIEPGTPEARACRCAIALDRPRYDDPYSLPWIVTQTGRGCGPNTRDARGVFCRYVIYG